MGWLSFQESLDGTQLKTDQAPQAGAGKGLSWDILAGKVQKTSRILYEEKSGGLLGLEGILSPNGWNLALSGLEIASGKSQELSGQTWEITGYDFSISAGASVEIGGEEFFLQLYPVILPPTLETIYTQFFQYDLLAGGGASTLLDLASFAETQFDLTVSATAAITISLHFTDQGNDSVVLPGTIIAGDVCIVVNTAMDDSDTDITLGTPSGFTAGFTLTQTGIGAKGRVSAKILDGTETTVTCGTTSSEKNIRVWVFRPSYPVTSISFQGWNGEITPGNPSAKSCDPSAETVPVVVLGMTSAQGGSYSLSGTSPAFSAGYTRDTGVGYHNYGMTFYNSSLLAQTVDMPDAGSRNLLATGYIKMS